MASKIIVLMTMMFISTVSVKSCHMGGRRSSHAKVSITDFFSKCLSDSAGKGFRWQAITRFAVEDTNWFEKTNNKYCGNGRDTDECWGSQLDFLIDPMSPFNPHVRRCMREYTKKSSAIPPKFEYDNSGLQGESGQQQSYDYEAFARNIPDPMTTPDSAGSGDYGVYPEQDNGDVSAATVLIPTSGIVLPSTTVPTTLAAIEPVSVYRGNVESQEPQAARSGRKRRDISPSLWLMLLAQQQLARSGQASQPPSVASFHPAQPTNYFYPSSNSPTTNHWSVSPYVHSYRPTPKLQWVPASTHHYVHPHHTTTESPRYEQYPTAATRPWMHPFAPPNNNVNYGQQPIYQTNQQIGYNNQYQAPNQYPFQPPPTAHYFHTPTPTPWRPPTQRPYPFVSPQTTPFGNQNNQQTSQQDKNLMLLLQMAGAGVPTTKPPMATHNPQMLQLLNLLKEKLGANGNRVEVPEEGSVVSPVVTGAMCGAATKTKFINCVSTGLGSSSYQRSASHFTRSMSITDFVSIFDIFRYNYSKCTSIDSWDPQSKGVTRKCHRSIAVTRSGSITCLPTIMLKLVKNNSTLRNLFLSCAS